MRYIILLLKSKSIITLKQRIANTALENKLLHLRECFHSILWAKMRYSIPQILLSLCLCQENDCYYSCFPWVSLFTGHPEVFFLRRNNLSCIAQLLSFCKCDFLRTSNWRQEIEHKLNCTWVLLVWTLALIILGGNLLKSVV